MTGFIIGTGRCGTTMLAQMLNSHSAICVPLELQILFEYRGNNFGLYEIFKGKKNEYFSANDFVDIIRSKCPHRFHEYFDYESYFAKQEYPILDLRELLNDFYSKIAEFKSKEIFIEQTPWYGQRIDILNELFPMAKYIHMIRDGRDVAISFARTEWWSDDIGQNLERWHNETNYIIDSSNKILNPDQFLQVRYEDFVDQPKNGLIRICEFLGVEFEDTMLDAATFIDYGLYNRSDSSHISSVALNEWSKKRKKPTFKGSLYVWVNYPGYDFYNLPEHINHSLKSLGYEILLPDGAFASLSQFSPKERLRIRAATKKQAAIDRKMQIYNSKMNKHPARITVLLITYNHSKHIEKSIESILGQQLDEPFEIVVADDDSTDSTIAILKRYAKQNSHIKFKFLESFENIGITGNYQRAFSACQGEYVAVMEGDDYWVSPYKLAKQCEFLDEHWECDLCSVNYFIYEEKFCKLTPRVPIGTGYTVLSARDLIADNLVGNFSACMYRRKALDLLPPKVFEISSYDWIINICIARNGLIGFLQQPMTVYRIHDDGAWSLLSQVQKLEAQLELIPAYDILTNKVFHTEFEALTLRLKREISKSKVKQFAEPLTEPVSQAIPTITDLLPPVILALARLLLPPALKRHLLNLFFKRII